jgi:hypothetical protein
MRQATASLLSVCDTGRTVQSLLHAFLGLRTYRLVTDRGARARPPRRPSGWTNARSPAYRADSVETLACLLAARVARNVSIGGFAK